MATPIITVQTFIMEAADIAGWLGGPSAVSVGARDPLIVNDSEKRSLRSCDVCAQMKLTPE
jgi:hypothetical protein